MVLTRGVEPLTLCPSNKGLFQLGYVSSYFLTQNCQSENDSLVFLRVLRGHPHDRPWDGTSTAAFSPSVPDVCRRGRKGRLQWQAML